MLTLFEDTLLQTVFYSPEGTALGLTTSIQMIGMGIANIIVGKMLDLIM